jgi:hypothetical protein
MLVDAWGETNDCRRVRQIMGLRTQSELRRLEVTEGTSYHNEERAEKLDEFIRIFWRSPQESGIARLFRYSPVTREWFGDSLKDALAGRKVESVTINLRTVLYLGGRFVVVGDESVRTVRVSLQ